MLSAQGLACVRGSRTLFSGIRIHLDAGQWAHVRGENGAGKTSLLRMLAGLSPPDEGEIRWLGEPIKHAGSQWRRDLLFLGHQAAIKDEFTPLENLRAANALDGEPLSDEAALRALVRMGLKGREHLPARVLSAGQKRRVLLARMLTRRAKVWILDEPFTALDADAVQALGGVVADHLAQGGIAVLTSHQPIPVPNGQELRL
jgi:heme exporter protein A